MKKHIYLLALGALLSATSCSSDYLDVNSTQTASKETIFENTDNVKYAVNGLARLMTMQYIGTQGFSGEGTVKSYYGNSSGNDSQKSNYTSWAPLFNSTMLEINDKAYDYFPWFYYYKLICNANAIVNKVDDAKGQTTDKEFLKAQALVFRAYSYSMLLQFYSHRWMDSNGGNDRGVVLRLNETNDPLPCSTMAKCYQQIYDDLDQSITLFGKSGKKRDAGCNYLPDLSVAYAVYARAAINREDWETAYKYAQLARKDYPLMSNSEYKDGGFNTPNTEWIWSVYSSESETLAYYQYFAYEGSNSSSTRARTNPAAISKELYEQIPQRDIRKDMFLNPGTDSYDQATGKAGTSLAARARADYGSKLYSSSNIYAYMQFKTQCKAQPGVGELNLFRAAEMYLIEAEACCHLDKDKEAQALLVQLNRDSGRNSEYTCTKTGNELLEEIRLYNRIELWGEGHDWFNYKRWGLPIIRHTAAQGGSFHSAFAITLNPSDANQWTWVIPAKETDYNPLIK